MISLPKDWRMVKIQELTIRTKQRDPSGRPEDYFRYVDISSVSNTLFKIMSATEILGSDAPSRARKEIKTNDILFATVRPTLKRIAIVPQELDGQIASTGYCVLRAQTDKVVPQFLYFTLLTRSFTKAMGALERGASYPAIRDADIFSASIPLPPLPEQRRIAYILNTVQTAIEQQERLIALTRELKSALMHKLFTEGLRGEPLKQTEIGLMPESWEVACLEDIARLRKEITTPTINSKGVYIGLEHIESSRFWYTTYGSPNEVRSSKNSFYRDDVLYGKLRPYLDKAAIATSDGICSTDILVLIPEKDFTKEFLLCLLHSNKLLEFAIKTTSGVNHPRTSWNSLKQFKFGLPQKAEREEISIIVTTLEHKISCVEKKQKLLTELFRTLLHQLMTGQIRVNEIDLAGLIPSEGEAQP